VCVTLVRRARGCLGAQLLDLCCEPVAHTLELPEIQQRRTLLRAGREGRSDVGEALADDRRELALEPRDLRLQRFPRRTLGVGRARAAILEDRSTVCRPVAAHRSVA